MSMFNLSAVCVCMCSAYRKYNHSERLQILVHMGSINLIHMFVIHVVLFGFRESPLFVCRASRQPRAINT